MIQFDPASYSQIVTNAEKNDNARLRKKTTPFDFAAFTPQLISKLVSHMRTMMHAARGIGLSANQIGLPWRLFVAEVPGRDGAMKFYAVFNPVIEKIGKETALLEEGCLSVPRVYGVVERAKELTLKGLDKKGKPIKIKAWGLLAHVFQHEVDHLDGKLFIDRAKDLRDMSQKPQ